MKPVWYIALRRFDSSRGEEWEKFKAWARLPQLKGVVSLDTILCPTLIDQLIAKDWVYNVQEDFLIDFFTDLEYLLSRISDRAGAIILAAIREPMTEDLAGFQDRRFLFIGFDLVESPGLGISALTNCGGFARAFQPSDLSQSGLLDDLEYARSVQRRLREEYPEEHHARCSLWALWKLEQEEGIDGFEDG